MYIASLSVWFENDANDRQRSLIRELKLYKMKLDHKFEKKKPKIVQGVLKIKERLVVCLFGWFLRHVNLFRLSNTYSCLYIHDK